MHGRVCQVVDIRGGQTGLTAGSERCEEAETPEEGASHIDECTELSGCEYLHFVELKCSEIPHAHEKIYRN